MTANNNNNQVEEIIAEIKSPIKLPDMEGDEFIYFDINLQDIITLKAHVTCTDFLDVRYIKVMGPNIFQKILISRSNIIKNHKQYKFIGEL